MELFFQVVGWIGMALVVSAYFLTTRQYVITKGKTDEFMNLFGAIGLGISVFHQQAWPAFVLQVIWGLIALYSLASPQKQP